LGFDPVSKILPAFVVGKRTKVNAYKLIEKIYRVIYGAIPFFTSDELKHYKEKMLYLEFMVFQKRYQRSLAKEDS